MVPQDGASPKTEMKMVVQAVQTSISSKSTETLIPVDEILQEDVAGLPGVSPDPRGASLSIQDCTCDLVYSQSRSSA